MSAGFETGWRGTLWKTALLTRASRYNKGKREGTGHTEEHEEKTGEIEQGQGEERDCCVEAVAGEGVGDKGEHGCEGLERERDGVVHRSEGEDRTNVNHLFLSMAKNPIQQRDPSQKT